MGHGLQNLPRDQIILATKVGRYDKAKFDFSAAAVTQSVHDSLRRLQVDYIDLIQTHDIEFGNLDQVCCLSASVLVCKQCDTLVMHFSAAPESQAFPLDCAKYLRYNLNVCSSRAG